MKTLVLYILILILISLGLAFSLFYLTGGKEIADDAGHLLDFAKKPFALWGDYRQSGIPGRWSSFPPLLPLLFGSLVMPWFFLGDFWAIRLGVLSWSIVAMIAYYFALSKADEIPEEWKKKSLIMFILLPSVWGGIALIPQEEIYVSLFVLAFYIFVRKGWWRWMVWLFILDVLAGKYFLLILAVPIALMSPRPLRYFLQWLGAVAAVLLVYIGYHRVFFGLNPLLSYELDPAGTLSIWGLLWNLGIRMPPRLVMGLSGLLALILAYAFSARACRKCPPGNVMAAVIYITILSISISFPAYVLWALPVMLISVGRMEWRGHRRSAVFLMFAWGVLEWSTNFFRGVALALGTDRPEGKEKLAAFAQKVLGTGFPFSSAHIACLVTLILCGIALVYILWKSGVELEGEPG